jgi:hypothetical protein
MEVKVELSTVAQCHPTDLWEIFQDVHAWRRLSSVFGDAAWVHGKPWERGSRFHIELHYPRRLDLEVVVLKCHAPHEVVLLSHGSGFAVEQWMSISPCGDGEQSLLRLDAAVVGGHELSREQVAAPLHQLFASWFEGWTAEAEKHCSLVAL